MINDETGLGGESVIDEESPGGQEGLLGPSDIAYHLDMTPAQLKIVHTALRLFVDDLGHEEHDVRAVALAVLDKLPGEHEIRAIDFRRGL